MDAVSRWREQSGKEPVPMGIHKTSCLSERDQRVGADWDVRWREKVHGQIGHTVVLHDCHLQDLIATVRKDLRRIRMRSAVAIRRAVVNDPAAPVTDDAVFGGVSDNVRSNLRRLPAFRPDGLAEAGAGSEGTKAELNK